MILALAACSDPWQQFVTKNHCRLIGATSHNEEIWRCQDGKTYLRGGDPQ